MADEQDITIRMLDESGNVEKEVGPEEPEQPIEFSDDDPNLVMAFKATPAGKKILKEIGEEVCRQYKMAWDNSKERRDKLAKAWQLFAGDLPDKTFPYQNCANAHVPITVENITRVVTRTEAEMADDWSAIVKFAPLAPQDKDQALLCEIHTNWQYRNQILDFKRQVTRGLYHFFFNGDVVFQASYDFNRMVNRHEALSQDEFVVPFAHVSTMPDYSDVPFRVRIYRYYRHELERMRGTWDGVDEVIAKTKPSWDDDPDSPSAKAMAEVTGSKMPDEEKGAAPYTLLWYEGWLTLPQRAEDPDDRQRFCKAIVDERTRSCLLLTVHEMEDPDDVRRVKRQNAEMGAFQMAQQSHAMETAQRRAMMDQHRMEAQMMGQPPIPDDEMMGDMPPPPKPPDWMEFDDGVEGQPPVPKPPVPARKIPIQLFSHGVLIEPIHGSVGLGFGRIQADYNIAANDALSMFADAATLANIWSLIVPKTLQVEGSEIKIQPGKVNYVKSGFAGALKDQIYELKAQPANPQLLELAGMMVGYGQSSIQAPDVLSGTPGKSGETFRGISTRVEQASKQLSVSARKFGDVLTQVTRNNSLLNSMFLADEEVFTVGSSLLALLDEAPEPVAPPMPPPAPPMPPGPPGGPPPGAQPPPPGGPAAAPPPGGPGVPTPPVHGPGGGPPPAPPGGPAPSPMGPPHPPGPHPPGMMGPPGMPPMPPPMMPPPPKPTTFTFKVGKKMYELGYHVEVRSDLKFSTAAERVQEADEMLNMAMKIPMLATNPSFMYHAVKKSFQARGWAAEISALGPAPMMPMFPPAPQVPPPGAGGPPQVMAGPNQPPPPKPPGPPDGIPGPKPGGQP